jgi:hypothetical protein
MFQRRGLFLTKDSLSFTSLWKLIVREEGHADATEKIASYLMPLPDQLATQVEEQ